MEDLSIEQVQEIAAQYYPDNVEEVMQAFYDMQAQAGTNNYETVLLIQKQLQADKQAIDAEQPKRFAGLAGRMA